MNWNRVLLGDSDSEVLPTLLREGSTFDLILTDPPYNLGKDFGNDSDSLELGAFVALNRRRLELCRDLLTPEGALIWFATHHYVGLLQSILYDIGLHYRRLNIWRYENNFSRYRKAPQGEFEPFLWFSRSATVWTYNGDDVRVPYKSTERLKNPVYYRAANGDRREWHPHPKGRLRGDVWEYPTLAGKRFQDERTEHPTQKPLSLMRDLVKAFCPKDADGRLCGTVLDPYCGSGTVPVACEQLNREGHAIRWLAVDLEERWVNLSSRRLEQVQPTLFETEGQPDSR